jgi:fructokinase
MSTSSEVVVVWGEVLWDRFPDGDQLGGAPANVAWHLGMAGGWPQLITRVGNDHDGRRAIARLSEHVDTALIQVDPERATGEVTVTLEAGEPRYTLQPVRAWERIACPPAAAQAIREAGVLFFGTLAQRTPEGIASWREAIAASRDTCLRVCDINLRPVDRQHAAIREALDAADLIKLNDRELGVLREWYGWDDPIMSLRAGRQRRIVALTHGERGSTLFGDGPPIPIPATPAVAGGDHVGCGDAYLAILVHGMTSGWGLEASARAASRWAAAVASVRGATPRFDDDRIAALLEET